MLLNDDSSVIKWKLYYNNWTYSSFFHSLTLDMQKYKPNKGFHGNRKDGCLIEFREPIWKSIWCS